MLRTNHTREFLQGFQDILNERIIEWGADPKTDVENYKEISKEDIIKLTEIKIKKITKYDKNKQAVRYKIRL